MAVLPDVDRQSLYAAFMEELSRDRAPTSLSKSDMRAAINAVDVWINDNMASFNNALPAEAKAGLTTKQKTRLLVVAIQRRWEVE